MRVKHARQREIAEAQAENKIKVNWLEEALKNSSAERVAAMQELNNNLESQKMSSGSKKNSPSIRARGIPDPLRRALPAGLKLMD